MSAAAFLPPIEDHLDQTLENTKNLPHNINLFVCVCVWHKTISTSSILTVLLFSGGVRKKTGGLLLSALPAVPL